jgi:hypothetical protein
LFKLDGMALDMGRRIAFIKAYGGLLGYESQSPEEGWEKVLDILDAEHKRLQAEWDASYKRFLREGGAEADRKTQKSQAGPKSNPRKESSGPEGLANCQLL